MIVYSMCVLFGMMSMMVLSDGEMDIGYWELLSLTMAPALLDSWTQIKVARQETKTAAAVAYIKRGEDDYDDDA